VFDRVVLGGVAVIHPREVAGDRGRHRAEDFGELVVVDQRGRTLAFAHRGELRLRETGVHEQDLRAELAGGEHGHDEPAVVAAQQGEHGAVVQPALAPRVRESVGAAVEVAEGELAEVVDESEHVAVTLGGDPDSGAKDPVAAQGVHRVGRLVRPGERDQPGLAQHPRLAGRGRQPLDQLGEQLESLPVGQSDHRHSFGYRKMSSCRSSSLPGPKR
jgi:hypothetical protein